MDFLGGFGGRGIPQQISPPAELLRMPLGPERDQAIADWRARQQMGQRGGGMPIATPLSPISPEISGGGMNGGGYQPVNRTMGSIGLEPSQLGTEELFRQGITAGDIYGNNISSQIGGNNLNPQYLQNNKYRQRFNPRWGNIMPISRQIGYGRFR